ncbi:MAG: (d)CMP kinase, partial [Mucinivorans sp.]
QRRYDELHGAVALADIEKNVRERDAADLSRQESPLRQATDATVLDNSRMTPEDQMIWFFDIFAPILQ